jgi:hypothetical protein
MKYFIILIMLMGFVTGCGSTQIKYVDKVRTITVHQPVYTPPEEIKDIKMPSRPDLATNHLTNDDKKDPDKVIKDAVKTVVQLRTYAEQLEIVIDQILMALENAEKKEGQ